MRRFIMTHKFQKLSHSIYKCKYHIVFCPKYRCRIFKGDVEEYTRQQVYRLCQQKDMVEVLELNVQTDHVHVVMSIAPKYAVVGHHGVLERGIGDEIVPTL